MSAENVWSIGELAERAGATVKTVRFYSDAGLLPEGARSAGGHRRYGPEALERLRLIRSLRALDLPVPEVGRVLDREDALEAALEGRLREVGSRLAELRWREAALRLVRDCDPEERAERLRLVGAVASPPSTDSLVRFWRLWLPPRLPAAVLARFLEQAVPELPESPTPEQVLAFARLHAMVTAVCEGMEDCQPVVHRPGTGYRPAVLYDGLGEAFALAAPELTRGRPPRAGEALDCFVTAYAGARGTRDTAGFRHVLSRELAADPRLDRYWRLVAELTGPAAPTPGAAHDWLRAALDEQLGPQAA
ncbi:MerR family transcriptional regulator [Streptomyces eurocidicus]|uniref:DNA-binding transcriptional MerR regulator n=1 Tax=Streptomyces eurocidicus TaxID=66423 RepID=A0A2N8NYI7_STREU|nr:MerR family transcriptional regulator [Streptomyces eurocidicus]MBB5121396.1 DNA-binding transcriptional MerR regulator [Streptomyces eurocidicus]MBF6050999.1 MerR family transcriptional regulator [Streptomyces eurocidicus]PNE33834.1 MerR family transcriptional regulator [Streptomyces eurocidicus]